MYRLYRSVLIPLLESRKKAWAFLGLVALLFVLAALLPALRLVPLKLLPYDNKNEFQLVLNMPESSSFVDTSNALYSFSDYLMTVPEVTSVSGFSGTASPMDFNGMVRHYFMRSEPYQGELRIVLAAKQHRSMQSHEIVTRLRSDLEQIAERFNADIQLVEVPPGPPVIATITAEVYGDETTTYEELMAQAEKVADRLRKEQLVSEVDTSVQGDLETWQFVVNQEKAALSGVSVAEVNNTLITAANAKTLGHIADRRELNPLPIEVQLRREDRDDLNRLEQLYVRGRPGIAKVEMGGAVVDAPQPVIQLSEIGHFVKRAADKPIFHKNLKPVVYVYAEVVGRVPGEIVADVIADQDTDHASDAHVNWQDRSYLSNGAGVAWSVPENINVVWSG